MLPKDYINYRLTGVHSCDYSDASGMLFLDVRNKKWSEEMLEICHIKIEQMPKLYESYERIGEIIPSVAIQLGLPCGVKVAAGAGDNAGAAVGTATVGNGKCNISLGTSGTIFVSSDKFTVDSKNALHAFCHSDGGYHLMGCMLSAASCNKWFCYEILKTHNYAEGQTEITEDRMGTDSVFFLPYLMGERSPVNDTDATRMFIGLRPDTTRADMVQAILEGVAFAIRDSLEVVKNSGIHIEKSTVCGGGAKSALWMNILCNVLNLELYLPKTEDGLGYGAALLAMVACGEYESVSDCAECEIKEIIQPDAELVRKYREKYAKFRMIYPAVKDLYKAL